MSVELDIFRTKLAEFRKKHDLSYQQIGESIGFTRGHICKIENGDSLPSIKILISLAKYMNVPFYYLFMPTEKMNNQFFIEKVENKLTALKWRLEELQKHTGINYFRLNDFMKENINLTREETEKIAEVLKIEEENSLNLKFGLFEALLDEFQFEESQIGNLMEYVQSNMK
ncbi:MAG: helix-turn-helix transcriptional regulator [Halanaerobiales bacterium]|nr:helix-turn-helix transcriptional regulator [Halanaerobiales bacterium]